MTALSPLTIRFAKPEDDTALERLAQLDSATPLVGPALVAERCGRLAAALSVASRRAVADPFSPTADLVDLLHARAAALHGGRARTVRRTAARRGAILAR